MKKIIAITVAFLSVLPLFGCAAQKPEKESKIRVVCTVFPQYDWVRQIIGDKADDFELTLLLDNKVDLHSYQPTVDDIAKISAADLFVYVGGESDEWADDAVSEAANKNMKVINLLETLGEAAKEEEVKPGMQAEPEEEDGGEREEAPEYDEHVWLSLLNAEVFCSKIENALSSLDRDNADYYKSNAAAYIDELSALNRKYSDAVNSASVKTLLFGDRFPFRYLVDDYGLDYYAAFVGCSAETEASFETIVFLAGKVDELSLKNIMVIEGSDRKIAETIRDNTKTGNQQILVMDSMQSVSASDVQNGATYLSIMENNLAALKKALS